MKNYISIITTTKTKKNADLISEKIVKSKLSPCVQSIQGVEALFYWNNKIENQEEIMLIIKADSINANKIKSIIKDFHEYETPEIIAYNFNIISKEYEKWFNEQ